ncbi:MAG: hypothetical protein WC722_05790 [Rhodospirillales bacterium]|jgi:hypothetical protein
MTARAIDLLGVDIGPDHPIGQRLREWLAPWSAKELASMLDTQPRTAKSWKAGNPPQFRSLVVMADRWGTGFLEYVFEPVLEESDLALERRLERIGRDVEIIKEEVRRAENTAKAIGPAAGVCRAENGSKTSGPAACASGRVASGPRQKIAEIARGAAQSLAVIALMAGLVMPDDDWARMSRAPKIPARIVRVQQKEA